jgi:hypothetical protein
VAEAVRVGLGGRHWMPCGAREFDRWERSRRSHGEPWMAEPWPSQASSEAISNGRSGSEGRTAAMRERRSGLGEPAAGSRQRLIWID